MLRIIRSNAVELLLGRLVRQVSEAPLASPFAAETIVVPSPAMGRWVNLGLARWLGAAANIDYPLPAAFLRQLSSRLLDGLPEEDPLAPERMAWKVFALLPELLDDTAFASPRNYLEADPDGLKRLQLADRVADVLDRYQHYRPDLIRAWSEGRDEDWQARLWRRLTRDLATAHRVAVFDRLAQCLTGTHPEPGDDLPERVSLFAVSSLPPLFVEAFRALAAHTRVDFYLHTPTDAFWADLVSQKTLARKRLERPEEADLWEVGNPLLASWGRQGQALQDLLLARETPLEEEDAFVEPPDDHLLHRLQRDIFTLRPLPAKGEREPLTPDDSVRIQVCHSALRECQVLHDQLLAMIDADPQLRPEDILVMVPEIGAYAPYIEAVFGRDETRARPFIPWNLSDISPRDEHPLLLVFLQLLDLPNSRFSHSEILSYLDVPELAEHFGLDDEAVAQVKDWLARANLRWGRDPDHKQRLGLPAVEENTWAQAERRLFGGYALEPETTFAGIAPVTGIEGSSGEVLGRFWRLFARLTEAAERLSAPRPAAAWQTAIGALLADFFGERNDADGRLQKIRDTLASLAEQAAGVDEPLSPILLRRRLEQMLGAAPRGGRYFSGGVTFCGMRPMRSLPFPVICVLGLHDQAFPRRDRAVEFDRMGERWRAGDPRKAEEDRYLFLETLLCARRRLYLSYVGRDIRNNTERQPSVLLRELLDYIDRRYRTGASDDNDEGEDDSGNDARLSERLTRVHPLQPFRPDNFAGDSRGYDDYWCEVARGLAAPADPSASPASPPTPRDWPDLSLPEPPEPMREVGLIQLERFLRHPVKGFVTSRLRIYLRDTEVEEDDEPFDLDGLQGFLLRQRLTDDDLSGRLPTPARLRAEGALPHGGFAELVYERERDRIAPLLGRLADYRGRTPRPVAVDLAFPGRDGPNRLTGRIEGVYPGLGLLCYRASKRKGADILGLWLAHLAWCAAEQAADQRSTLHTTSAGFMFDPLPPDRAHAILADLLQHYWRGLHRPLPVLPKASYAFARRRATGKGNPLADAQKAWTGNAFQGIPGDRDDPYVQLIRRGAQGNPLDDPAFAALAEALYLPALGSGRET